MGIRKLIGVINSIHEKVRKVRLHMHGMEENNEVRTIVDNIMRVPEKRPRGRPRRIRLDGARRDIQGLRITPDDAQDRTFTKSRILAADPT